MVINMRTSRLQKEALLAPPLLPTQPQGAAAAAAAAGLQLLALSRVNGSDILQVKLEGKDFIACLMREEEQWGFPSDADAGAEKEEMKMEEEEQEEQEKQEQ